MRKKESTKRRRSLSALSLAVICSLLLSGCSALSLSGPDILAPPKADGSKAEIQTLIEQSSGGDYTLIYPASGEFKSAVILRDMNADGEEEAVAMYSVGDGNARVLFAKPSDGGYQAIGEGKVHASLIDCAAFADLDGDGVEEFIVDYPDPVTPLCSVSVMNIGSELKQTDMLACCHSFITGDFESKGCDDILLLTLAGTVSNAAAKLMSYSDNILTVRTSCDMDSQLTSYAKLSYGVIGEQVSGAVIDGRNSAGEYSTQIIYFDQTSRALTNPLLIYSGYSSTVRAARIMSADVDRDDVIEIPLCSLCDYSPTEDAGTVCRKISWNTYSPSGMALVNEKTALLCDTLGFMLNLSDEKVGAVTARYTAPNSVSFYVWEFVSGVQACTDKLLTINYYEKEAFDSGRILEAVLCETNTGVYTYAIEPVDNFLSFSDDEVTSGFVLTLN